MKYFFPIIVLVFIISCDRPESFIKSIQTFIEESNQISSMKYSMSPFDGFSTEVIVDSNIVKIKCEAKESDYKFISEGVIDSTTNMISNVVVKRIPVYVEEKGPTTYYLTHLAIDSLIKSKTNDELVFKLPDQQFNIIRLPMSSYSQELGSGDLAPLEQYKRICGDSIIYNIPSNSNNQDTIWLVFSNENRNLLVCGLKVFELRSRKT